MLEILWGIGIIGGIIFVGRKCNDRSNGSRDEKSSVDVSWGGDSGDGGGGGD